MQTVISQEHLIYFDDEFPCYLKLDLRRMYVVSQNDIPDERKQFFCQKESFEKEIFEPVVIFQNR